MATQSPVFARQSPLELLVDDYLASCEARGLSSSFGAVAVVVLFGTTHPMVGT